MWNEYTFAMPTWAEQVALVAPVDLGLRARDDLEPAVQPASAGSRRRRRARRRSAAGPRPETS